MSRSLSGPSSRRDLDQLATAANEALERGLFTRRMLLARIDEFGDRAALRIRRALATGSD